MRIKTWNILCLTEVIEGEGSVIRIVGNVRHRNSPQLETTLACRKIWEVIQVAHIYDA